MFRALESATTSNPQKLEEALRSDPSLTHIVRELHTLFLRIEDHRKRSKRRVIPQAHPEFLDAISRYGGSWTDSWLATLPEIDLSDLLIGVPASTNSEPDDAMEEEEELWDFDPDSHSAADHVDGVMENASYKSNEYPFFSRAEQAWTWLRETMDIDLSDMEARWREIPVLAVKESVSNKHGINEQKSLYAYLDNVRKAYVAGADLAALAMCRSITEILFRFHYNQKDEKTNLTLLVEKTIQARPQLAKYNIVKKLYEANKLMHFSGSIDAERWRDVRVLVRNWFLILNELVALTPNELPPLGSTEVT